MTSPLLAPTASGRWRYAATAVFMQILLGVIYSWSIFRGPLATLHGWSKAETIAPYRYSLLAFAAGMILAGMWQDRKGLRPPPVAYQGAHRDTVFGELADNRRSAVT